MATGRDVVYFEGTTPHPTKKKEATNKSSEKGPYLKLQLKRLHWKKKNNYKNMLMKVFAKKI